MCFLFYNCGVGHSCPLSPFLFFTFKLLSICYFFNVWEHFLFSFFVTNHFLQIAKIFRLFGQISALKIKKHRFWIAKAMLLACKTSSFTLQNLCFYNPKNTVLGRFRGIKKGWKLMINVQLVYNQGHIQPQNPCVFTSWKQVRRFRWHSREVASDFLTMRKLTICKQPKGKKVKRWRGKKWLTPQLQNKKYRYILSLSPLIKGRGELHNLFFYLLCGGCILSPLHLFTFTGVGKVGYSRLK